MLERRRSLEELYRLHEDAGEWAEASKLFLQIMERDHGFLTALNDMCAAVGKRHVLRRRVHYLDRDAYDLDQEEFERENSIGGQTYKERR